MRYIILIVAIGAGIIWALMHPYAWLPKEPVTGSLTELQNDLHKDKTWKVVIITASWCPACRQTMPTYANINMGSYVSLYALALDKSDDEVARYAHQIGGNITWVRAKECSSPYCSNMMPMLATLGIHYLSSIPFISIFDPDGHLFKDNIPAEYVECTIRRQCDVTCSGDRCIIKNL